MALRDRLSDEEKKKNDPDEVAAIEWDDYGNGVGTIRSGRIPVDVDVEPDSDFWRMLLEHFGVTPDDYEIIPPLQVRLWDNNLGRDPETGETCVQVFKYVKVSIAPRGWAAAQAQKDPKFIAIAEPTPVIVKIPKATHRLPQRKTLGDGWKCAVVYGDAQIWHFLDKDGKLRTTHDEAAIDLSFQITQDVEAEYGINRVVDLGDFLDLPTFSKHQSPTTMTANGGTLLRLSTDRGHAILQTRTALTPNVDLHEHSDLCIDRKGRLVCARAEGSPEREIIKGNHDQRLLDWMADKGVPIMGWVAPGESEPVLSFDFVLGAKKAGWIANEDSYPNGVVWLNPNLRCVHGDATRGLSGAILDHYLKDKVSTIAGHSPHVGWGLRTFPNNRRPGKRASSTYVSATVGGCMKTDGSVPSAKTKNSAWGTPTQRGGDPWEQGMAIVLYDVYGREVPQIDIVTFYDGVAYRDGKKYEARVTPDGDPVD